MDEVEVAVFI